MQHALLSVTLEPWDVLAVERMTVVISMVMMENAYKHVIMWEITSTAMVYKIRAYTYVLFAAYFLLKKWIHLLYLRLWWLCYTVEFAQHVGVKHSVRRKKCIFRSKILSLEVELGCLVVIGKISLLYLNVWTISSISDPLVGGWVDFMYG